MKVKEKLFLEFKLNLSIPIRVYARGISFSLVSVPWLYLCPSPPTPMCHFLDSYPHQKPLSKGESSY